MVVVVIGVVVIIVVVVVVVNGCNGGSGGVRVESSITTPGKRSYGGFLKWRE